MLRCRDGVTNLSGKLSHGDGTRLFPPHKDKAVVERCGRMSAHDLWCQARQERGPAAAFVWREAGLLGMRWKAALVRGDRCLRLPSA